MTLVSHFLVTHAIFQPYALRSHTFFSRAFSLVAFADAEKLRLQGFGFTLMLLNFDNNFQMFRGQRFRSKGQM